MSEQPLDLRATIGAVWGRRRLVRTLAGIGLLGGLAYGVTSMPSPSAVALVLLPPTSLTSSGTPTRDVQTEIVIATSTPVLSAAGKAVSPALGANALRHHVNVTALSQDVLQIQVTATNGRDAERLANAVANDYIEFLATSSSSSTKNALAGLQHESAQLTQQIQGLQGQINTVSTRLTSEGASSTAGQRDSALLGSLSTEQQQVSLQLDNVNNQVVTDQLSGAAAAQGTRILQRATTVGDGSVQHVTLAALLGLALGLVIGVPSALFRSRRDRRLRRRDDVARAIGVPVLGSLEAPQCQTPAEWVELLGEYDPSAVDMRNLRHILSRLRPGAGGTGSTVAVVSFAHDRAAAAAGLELAMYAEVLGMPTTLVPGEGETFDALRAAGATWRRPDGPEAPGAQPATGPAWDHVEGQLTLATVAVDPALPELGELPGVVLVAVSSGFATADALARLALAAVDAGHALDGVIVINPDASDTTTGAAPASDATALTASWHDGSESRFANGSGSTLSAPVGLHSPSSANGNGTGHGASSGNGSGTWVVHTQRDGDPGAFISLRVVAAAARRHWRPLVAVALVGMILGASIHLVVPRKYSATTNLYLTEPAALDPAQAMANDVSLLQTRAVAERAIAALHVRTTSDSFLTSYEGVALSNAILQITVSGPTGSEAVSRADAVARAFLAVRTNLLRLQTQVVVSGLQGQVRSLDSEINNLTTSIDALSTSPTGTSGDQLADLVDQRSEDTSQVSTLVSQIQQEQLNETSVTQASEVIDRGAAVKVSAAKVTVIDALSGLMGGLGLALIVLIATVLLSDRLRSRNEVADAVGAPVELSVARYAPRRSMRPRQRLKLVTRPSPELRMIERRLRAQLDGPGGAALIVAEAGTVEPCAVAVAGVALSLASEGRRVVMADVARDRPLAALFGVTSREKELHNVTLGSESAFLIIGPDDPAEMDQDWMPNGADALLVLASVDPAFGAEHLAGWAGKAVVVVDPRQTTATRVQAIGALLRQARIAVRSAIVIGADPEGDDTLGSTPDHLGAVEQHAPGVLASSGR